MDLRPFMERWHMLPPSGGVMLVAVSGGRDSVCLLHYLAAMPRDFTVAAAHLDHGQRPTAGRDVAFVDFPILAFIRFSPCRILAIIHDQPIVLCFNRGILLYQKCSFHYRVLL